MTVKQTALSNAFGKATCRLNGPPHRSGPNLWQDRPAARALSPVTAGPLLSPGAQGPSVPGPGPVTRDCRAAHHGWDLMNEAAL
jgi:hypothetical protein